MPSTIEALIIIALVTTPGYICGKLVGRVSAFEQGKSDLIVLIQSVVWGTVVQIALSWRTVDIVRWYRNDELHEHPIQLVAWGAVSIIVAPAVVGVGLALLIKVPRIDRFLDRIGLGYVDRMPSAWDFAMRRERSGVIRIHLRDGTRIGGMYDKKSFASLVPGRTDIFLEEAWKLDENTGDFLGVLPDTTGVWVAHDLVAYAEFFDAEERNREELHASEDGSATAGASETASG